MDGCHLEGRLLFPCDPHYTSMPGHVQFTPTCRIRKRATIAHQRRQRLIGIGLMCGAVALFAVLDTTAKYLNAQMDTLQIAWARYTSAFVLTLIVSNPLTHPDLLRTKRPQAADRALDPAGRLERAEFPGAALAAARRGAVDHLHLSVHGRHRCPVRCWANGSAGGAGARSGSAFGGVLLMTRPGFGGMHPAALALAGGDRLLRLLRRDHAHRVARRFQPRPRCSMPTASARW